MNASRLRAATMIKLDTQTLLFVAVFICFQISILMMLAALQTKRDPCLLWTAIGFSLLGFGALIIALHFWSSWLLLAIWLSNSLIILTHGCIWSALRLFSNKKIQWTWLLLGPALWALLCLWPRFITEPAWRVLAYTLIATSYYLLALKEIGSARRQNTQAVVPLAILLISIIIFYLYRLSSWVSDAEFWSQRPDAQITLFIMMIMVTYLGFMALILVRGREEYRYKLASMQDSLTQLPNRRALFDYAPPTINKAQTQQKEISLLMCDLDHFKQINDQYGHDIGDEVLKLFARVLKDIIGKQGFYARIGGEEFVILFTDQSLQAVKALAANVNHELTSRSNRELSINASTSIGIATATQVGYSLSQLLKCADMALYQAKASNRNCVRVWSESLEESCSSDALPQTLA